MKAQRTKVYSDSMRGVVLSYVISEPGVETVQTITDDLHTDSNPRDKMYRSVFMAVDSLSQRGLIRLGEGPNKSNQKLWPKPEAFDVLE